jgi:glutathione S-transferase
MEMIMKLYGFPGSPNTWKVRAVAAHLGLVLDEVLVDLGKGEQRSPDYLSLNPTARTPTLVDGDFVLWEATAIMQYLASQTPNALWPDDARTRADIMRWQSWHQQHWAASACTPLLFENFVKGFFDMGAPDAAIVAKATESFHREAAVLDAHLAKRSFLVGSGVSLADFTVVSPLVYAAEGGLPLERYPQVRDWSARILSLPAWRATAPNQASAAA